MPRPRICGSLEGFGTANLSNQGWKNKSQKYPLIAMPDREHDLNVAFTLCLKHED